MNQVKNIILCADDYGLNAAVSQGILQLLQRQRLSAVSCLVTFADWRDHANLIKNYNNQIDIGLHLNFTQGQPLSPRYRQRYGNFYFSVSRLICRAFLHQLDVEILQEECTAQVERFVAEMGFLPDFIDGHQHIQLLPQIRTALLSVYKKYYISPQKAYMRSLKNQLPALTVSDKIKQAIIYLCGAAAFEALLKEQQIPYNSYFAGVYSFSQDVSYARYFQQLLPRLNDRTLLMCHPALAENSDRGVDVIADARSQEYAYLDSDQFIKDCQLHHIQLTQGKGFLI